MARRGPRPTPTALKIVPGGKATRPGEPTPEPLPSVPAAPSWLCRDAKAEWARVGAQMHVLGLLTKLDLGVMCAYCDAYATFVKARQALAKLERAGDAKAAGGLLAIAANGTPMQNPLLGIINVSKRDLIRFAAELGMTPSARSRINVDKAQGNASRASKYFNRTRPV